MIRLAGKTLSISSTSRLLVKFGFKEQAIMEMLWERESSDEPPKTVQAFCDSIGIWRNEYYETVAKLYDLGMVDVDISVRPMKVRSLVRFIPANRLGDSPARSEPRQGREPVWES